MAERITGAAAVALLVGVGLVLSATPADARTTDVFEVTGPMVTLDQEGPVVGVCAPGYPDCDDTGYMTTRRDGTRVITTGITVIYLPPVTTSIETINLAHPYLEKAGTYWQSKEWCPPTTISLTWVYQPGASWQALASGAGCWTGQKWVLLNNYYIAQVGGWSPGKSWCAITIHEMGHLLGYRWETCRNPWHNCWNKDSIMHAQIFHVPKVCQ